MIDNPQCPACSATTWEPIGRQIYTRNGAEQMDSYTRNRFRVLFEIWFHDLDTITLTFALCRQCGFVTYLPRPSPDDIDGKHRLLGQLGSPSYAPALDDPTESYRATRLHRILSPFISPRARLLDVGGGSGRLVLPFRDEGFSCSLVDFCRDIETGIVRLGNFVEDIPPDARFELIVCSHVLEHLPDPYDTVCRLTRHLSERGIIYLEVPVEIWKGPPRVAEPVTHINFFTEWSLRALAVRAGLVPMRTLTEACSIGHPRVVTGLVGAIGEGQAAPPLRRYADKTRRLLTPTLSMQLCRAIMFRGQLLKGLRTRWLRRDLRIAAKT